MGVAFEPDPPELLDDLLVAVVVPDVLVVLEALVVLDVLEVLDEPDADDSSVDVDAAFDGARSLGSGAAPSASDSGLRDDRGSFTVGLGLRPSSWARAGCGVSPEVL